MNKIFLYLFPIEEYTKDNLCDDERYYDIWKNGLRPLPILNECIQKRYRNKGYQVVYALFPDRDLFGLELKAEDKIIYTDTMFEELNSRGKGAEFISKYPSSKFLLEQLGNVSELVIGGYHAADCVKKVGETAISMDIDTLVDLDMTELFFYLYDKESYFKIDEYDPKKFFKYATQRNSDFGRRTGVCIYFSSPVYGFHETEEQKLSRNMQGK